MIHRNVEKAGYGHLTPIGLMKQMINLLLAHGGLHQYQTCKLFCGARIQEISHIFKIYLERL